MAGPYDWLSRVVWYGMRGGLLLGLGSVGMMFLVCSWFAIDLVLDQLPRPWVRRSVRWWGQMTLWLAAVGVWIWILGGAGRRMWRPWPPEREC
jgi:hypothetical protein